MTEETNTVEESAAPEAVEQPEAQTEETSSEDAGQEAPETQEEDRAASAEQEAQPEETPEKTAAQKRIAQLVKEREDARRELAAARALIEKRDERQAEEATPDFRAEVEKTAAQLVRDQRYTEDVNKTYSRGVDEFPNFSADVRPLIDTFNIGDRREFMGIVNDLENGPAVLRHLGKNLDEASSLLEMEPGRMALSLAKLSGKLTPAPRKTVSSAPPPPETVSGRASTVSKEPEKMSMAEFDAWHKERREKHLSRP